jgi:hypothetical protein
MNKIKDIITGETEMVVEDFIGDVFCIRMLNSY